MRVGSGAIALTALCGGIFLDWGVSAGLTLVGFAAFKKNIVRHRVVVKPLTCLADLIGVRAAGEGCSFYGGKW